MRLHFFVFFFCVWINSCKPTQIGGNSLSPTPPPPGSGGTIKNFSFSSSGVAPFGTVRYSFEPECAAENDYLICTVNIFNSQVQGYPLIHTATYSYHCFNYGIRGEVDITCQTPCADSGDTCMWITLICANTTKGNILEINDMPPNITCGS